MMAVIIFLGAGITFGYFYKRSVSQSQHKENKMDGVKMEDISLGSVSFCERGTNIMLLKAAESSCGSV